MQALKRHFITGTLVLILGSSVMAQESGVHWQNDLEAAKRIAATSGRLVLIHFWAPWCGPCMRLERNVLNRASVGQAVEAQFVPVKLNADLYPASAHRYGVTSLPTDVILTSDGRMINKANSPPTAQAYLGRLMQIAAQYRPPDGSMLAQGTPPTRSRESEYRNSQSGESLQRPIGMSTPQTNNPYGAVAQTTPPPASAQQNLNHYAQANTVVGPPQLPNRYPLMASAGGANPSGSPQAAIRPPLGHSPPPAAPGSTQQDRTNSVSSPIANRSPVGDRYASLPQNSASSYAGQSSLNNYSSGPVPPTQPSSVLGAPYGNPPMQPAMRPNGGPMVGQAQQPASPVVGAVAPRSQMPTQTSESAQRPPSRTALTVPKLPPGNPPLGLNGYCPVTLKTSHRWVMGDTRWGAIHQGRTYLFVGQNEQQQFLANPDVYSPVLSGYDVVLVLDQGQSVVGYRQHGVFYGDRVYLFSSEETLSRFRLNPKRYADGVQQVLQARRTQVPPR